MSTVVIEPFVTENLARFGCRAHSVIALSALVRDFPGLRVTHIVIVPSVNGDLFHITIGNWTGTLFTTHGPGAEPRAWLSLSRPGYTAVGTFSQGQGWDTEMWQSTRVGPVVHPPLTK